METWQCGSFGHHTASIPTHATTAVCVTEVDAGTTAADEDELEVDETPTKVVTEHITFSMQATVSFVEDFSGCSDGHSLRNNLAKLAPRALVLIGADEQTTGHMAAACSKQLPAHQTRVFTPGGCCSRPNAELPYLLMLQVKCWS